MYIWTDEKGIKHFSNSAPPPSADAEVRDEIQTTPEEREAEMALRLERRRERQSLIDAKNAEEKERLELQRKLQRERDAIEQEIASQNEQRTAAEKTRRDHIKYLEGKANQWYPGKDKNIWAGSKEERMNSLTDPRRLEAERAQRELYGDSDSRQTESFEEEDKYWEKGEMEEQDLKPWHDTEGTLYTPASGGYINTKTGDFCTQAGSHEVFNNRTGKYIHNPTGFDD